MEKVIALASDKSSIQTLLADLLIVVFIYFIPAISHLFAFPVYYLDPMRIAIVFALIATSKKNTFLIALTLPIFSFLISSHPSMMKSFLLVTELLLNLGIFFLIKDKFNNIFLSFLTSIIFSKIVYYLLKFVFINSEILDDQLFSTPVIFQIIVAVVSSTTIFVLDKKYKLFS